MPKKKYNVTLSPAEESFLKSITHKGKNYSAREIIHAQVLLHSNDNRPQDKKDNFTVRELVNSQDIFHICNKCRIVLFWDAPCTGFASQQ